jgi:transcriptional regulator with GAF, ATPase, and Fis domain
MPTKSTGVVVVPDQIDFTISVDAYERCLIFEALKKSDYSISKAAVLLNLKRTTLAMMLKRKKIVIKERETK